MNNQARKTVYTVTPKTPVKILEALLTQHFEEFPHELPTVDYYNTLVEAGRTKYTIEDSVDNNSGTPKESYWLYFEKQSLPRDTDSALMKYKDVEKYMTDNSYDFNTTKFKEKVKRVRMVDDDRDVVYVEVTELQNWMSSQFFRRMECVVPTLMGIADFSVVDLLEYVEEHVSDLSENKIDIQKIIEENKRTEKFLSDAFCIDGTCLFESHVNDRDNFETGIKFKLTDSMRGEFFVTISKSIINQ